MTVPVVEESAVNEVVGRDLEATIAALEKRMREAAAELEFEEAARLRDEIRRLEAEALGLPPPPLPSARFSAQSRAPGAKPSRAPSRRSRSRAPR